MAGRITRYFLLFGSASFSVQAGAQCSIPAMPDQTICAGQTASWSLPGGFPSYLWSTGATSPGMTTGTAGTYWGQVSYPSGQLITNGNFSAGNTGFTSNFTYTTDLWNEPTYYIGLNANTYHWQFTGVGAGNFMIINAGWMHAGWTFWCQTVPVCPGQTYTLSFRSCALVNVGAPDLQWEMDGVPYGPTFTPPVGPGVWQTFNTTWTSGPGQTSVDLCLRVNSGWGIGNDFGIDDIGMQGTIILRDTVQLNVTPLPVVNLGPNVTLCDGQTMLLNATVPGGTYLWQDGSTGPTFNVTGPGIYNVNVTASNCSNSDAVTINYNPIPVVDLGNDTTLCAGGALLLNVVTPGGTYTWQNGSTSPMFNVTSAGVYDVDVTIAGCTGNDAITVNYNPLPVVDLGNDTALCAGSTLLLDAAQSGGTYLWQDGSTSSTYTVSTPGGFDVDVTVNGCTSNDAIAVSYNPIPVVDLGNDTTVCPGESLSLDAAQPGASYVWQDGSTSSTFTTTTPGVYSVDVTINNCTGTDAITLSNFTLQAVDLGPDVSICAGSTTSLSTLPVAGASYLWSTGGSGNSISTGAGGTYWIDVALSGCVVRDSVDVSIIPLPVFSLGNDTALCPGEVVTLDAMLTGGTYLWSTGATGSAITVPPGSYSVDVTVNGCTSSDAISVSALSPPVVDLGNDTTLCPGATLLLMATTLGASYLWEDGSSGSTHLVSSSGTYSVVVTGSNGCPVGDAIDVLYASPTAIDLGPDTTLCAGTNIVLDAFLPGASYDWSTGATTSSITVALAGTYSVDVTQGSCMVSDAINVGVAALPVVSLGNDTTLCPSEDLLLDATLPGVSHLWQDGSTLPTLLVSTAGTYSVTVTNAAGCSGSDAIDVLYASPSALDLGPDTSFCLGGSALLDATLPGSSYLWSTGATSPTISVSASGTYSVDVLQGSCMVSDAIDVLVLPMPVVDLGNDTTLCSGATMLLDATYPGATYLWSTSATSPGITVSGAGIYSVTVDLAGCTASDAITVSYLSAVAIDLGNDTALCPGLGILLDASLPGATYLWQDGSTSATYFAPAAGLYSVQVTVSGCNANDAITITTLPPAVADLGNDTTLCVGASLALDVSLPGATYLWQDGSTSSLFTVVLPGIYSVEVDLNGCLASDDVTVAYLTPNSVDLGADTMLCPGATLPLSAAVPGGSYLWQDGSTAPGYTVAAGGSYWVVVQVAGCSAGDTIDVGITPIPQPALGPDAQLCEGDSLLLTVGPGTADVLWSDGSTGTALLATTTGTYTVTLTLDGCMASDAIDVDFTSVIDQVDLGPDLEICDGDVVQLDATTPGAAYQWNTNAVGAAITVDLAGEYWVQITGECINAADTVVVVVGQCAPIIHVPNAFTPDGNGNNDVFQPVIHGALISYELLVFDRWGEAIFTTTDAAQGWNGTLNGADVQDGVYVWTIAYKAYSGDGLVHERLTGHVTLLR